MHVPYPNLKQMEKQTCQICEKKKNIKKTYFPIANLYIMLLLMKFIFISYNQKTDNKRVIYSYACGNS